MFKSRPGRGIPATNSNTPARRVIKSGGRSSITGYVSCVKGGGLVPFESLLEEGLIDIMKADETIASLKGQPETFKWRSAEGKLRRYTPDFFCLMSDGRKIFREAKRLKRLLSDPMLNGRRSDIERECLARGASFEIWTEVEILGKDPEVRVATPEEAAAFRSAIAAGASQLIDPAAVLPRTALSIIEDMEIECGTLFGGAWIGLSRLTNLYTALPLEIEGDVRSRSHFVTPPAKSVAMPGDWK
jgi:hypothetical protein